jgi:FMN phosphatase YigB (HAD superfamily)
MDHRTDKLILVDCDGVLLDWKYSFVKWMSENNYEVVREVSMTSLKCSTFPKEKAEY